MPIPRYPDWQPLKATAADERLSYDVTVQPQSEESAGIQEDDGPLPLLTTPDTVQTHRDHDDNEYPEENICTDRAELIERIKRGESPTWVPNKAVSGVQKIVG